MNARALKVRTEKDQDTPRRVHADRSSSDDGSDLALGMMVGGALGVLAAIALGSNSKPQQSQRLIVGGVDLTSTDLSRPFCVEFAGGDARNNLRRASRAMVAFGEKFPTWSVEPQALPSNVYRLFIDPTARTMKEAVAARVFG